MTTPAHVRVPLAALVWLSILTQLTGGALQAILGSATLAAGLLTVGTAIVAARRFERRYGAAFRHPVSYSRFMMWLLAVPLPWSRERWELPLFAVTALGVGVALVLVAINT